MLRKTLTLVLALSAAVIFTACNAVTSPATDVRDHSAVLHAKVGWNKGETVTWWFETKAASGSWVRDQVNGPATFQNSAQEVTINEEVTGLQSGTTYQFRICGYFLTSGGDPVGSAQSPICVDQEAGEPTDHYSTFTTTGDPPDVTPPQTVITSAPTGTINISTAQIAFSSSEAGSTFQCKLDSAAWGSCQSPKSYSDLADGAHTVSVRATDQASNTDPTPATASFTVSTQILGGSWPLFAPTSPFNTKLTATRKAEVSPQSASAVSNWVSSWSIANGAPGFSVGYGGSSDDYDHPIYFAKASDPKYTVQYREDWGNGNGAEGQTIPIPAGAKPAGGSDDHLAVITPDGWEYDFWQADAPSGGVISASYGGRTRTDGDGLRVAATESHFALSAGIITPEELEAGQINHALFMVINQSNGNTVWPAEPQPHSAKPGMPPYGAHFYLDYTPTEISNAPWPAWKKTIVRAASTYGFYFGDTGGGSLKTQSGIAYTSQGESDPWIALAKSYGIPNNPWNGHPSYKFDLTSGVDWAGRTKMLVPAQAGF